MYTGKNSICTHVRVQLLKLKLNPCKATPKPCLKQINS